MATLENRTKLAAVIKDNQQGHPVNDLSRDTDASRINQELITKFLRKLRAEWSKTYLRNSLEPRAGYQVHCQSWENFLNHKSGCNPDPYRQLSRTLTRKIRNVTRTVPSMILIVKWKLQLIAPLTHWSQTLTLYFTARPEVSNWLLAMITYSAPSW